MFALNKISSCTWKSCYYWWNKYSKDVLGNKKKKKKKKNARIFLSCPLNFGLVMPDDWLTMRRAWHLINKPKSQEPKRTIQPSCKCSLPEGVSKMNPLTRERGLSRLWSMALGTGKMLVASPVKKILTRINTWVLILEIENTKVTVLCELNRPLAYWMEWNNTQWRWTGFFWV